MGVQLVQRSGSHSATLRPTSLGGAPFAEPRLQPRTRSLASDRGLQRRLAAAKRTPNHQLSGPPLISCLLSDTYLAYLAGTYPSTTRGSSFRCLSLSSLLFSLSLHLLPVPV